MKKIKLLIGLLVLLFAKQAKGQEYCVVKIDTTQKLYIITVKNDNFEGVILSEREQCAGGQLIIEGKVYKLDIKKHSILKLINVLDLTIKSRGKPSIFVEDVDVCKLAKDCVVYQSDSLCGLYLIE